MFTLIGIDRILGYVQDRNMPYWAFYDSDTSGRHKVADNFAEKNPSIEDSIRNLRKALNDFVTGGRFYLWVVDKPTNKAGGFYTWISLVDYSGQPVANTQQHPQSIAGVPNVQELINKEIEKVTLQFELKQKNKEIEGLKKELKEAEPDGLSRVAARLEPYIGIIMDSIGIKKAVASAAISGNNESEEQIQKIAEEALETLAADEPDFHLTLQKLAELKKTQPEKYKLAKSML